MCLNSQKSVKISLEAWKTLKTLSSMSQIDGNAILESYLKSCQDVLDNFKTKDYQKLGIMSCRNPKDNIEITYLGRLFIGKLPLVLEEAQMEKDMDPEILRTNQKVKRVKVKFTALRISGDLQDSSGKIHKTEDVKA
jgi:hypothetical protein